MTDPGRAKRRLLGFVRLAAVLVGAAVFAALFTRSLQDNDSYASILSGIATIVTLFLGVFDHLRRQDPIPAVDEAAADLRHRLLQEWEQELHRRIQGSPHEKTIPLEWRKYGGSGAPSPLDGRFEGDPEDAAKRLAERFDERSGKKRMVVLGEPGAGKTFIALALTVGLLRRWTDAKRIAVHLSMSTWDPLVETLDEWMVDAIAKSYYFGEERIPRALLTDRRLVPVLDGLDELPEHLRRLAVRSINNSLIGDRMLVITCRTAEYEDVLTGSAPLLLRAPAVEVRPVISKDVRARLQAVPAWADLVRHVESRPSGPLATALSTPLMLSLFTVGYLQRDPAPLLDQTKFASRHDIEDHLVDLKLDTAYPERAPRGQWSAKQARKWLTFLAQHMHENDEREITWRKLARRAITTSTQLIVAITLSAGLLWLGTLHSTLVTADFHSSKSVHATSTLFDSYSLTAVVLGTLAAAVWLASRRHLKTPVEPSRNKRLTGFKRGMAVGFTVVAVPGAFFTLIASAGRATYDQVVDISALTAEVLVLALVSGAAVGMHEMMVERVTSMDTAHSTWDGLNQERTSTCLAAAAAGLVAGALSIPASVLATSLGSHVGQRLATSLGFPAVADLALPPVETYLRWPFTSEEVVRLAEASALIALLFAVMLAATRPWARLLAVRVKLAVTGRLPWRFRRFLTDATKRGLLRRVGTAHQFGHALLQVRLVSTAAPETPVYRRTRVRIAAAAVASLLLVTMAGTVWSGSPHHCRTTQWDAINDRMARATIGPDTACFAVFDEFERTNLQRDKADAQALATITAEPPRLNDLFPSVPPIQTPLLIVGEFDQFSATRWHDILIGLASAKQLGSYPIDFDFVFSDFEQSDDPEATTLTHLYLQWAHARREISSNTLTAVNLDGASSMTMDNGWPHAHIIGLDDAVLGTRAKEYGASQVRRFLLPDSKSSPPTDALLDGVGPDECTAIKKRGLSSLSFDLRQAQLTATSLNDISACGRARILVTPDQAASLTMTADRPANVKITYLSDQSESIALDCERAIGVNPSADSIKACVAAVAATDSFRVAIKELPDPVQR